MALEHLETSKVTALEWDIATWGRALDFWASAIQKRAFCLDFGLELGARNGGLSWYFSNAYGSRMICSDLAPATEKARFLHQKSGLTHLIHYEQADALQLKYPDNHFDFVVFKSMLGAVGQSAQQQQAIAEIYRVLKPGGVLFFAENLKASRLHQWARRWFVPWGNRWHYVTLKELDTLLRIFSEKQLYSTGFISAFIPKPEPLKNMAAQLDQLLYFTPTHWRYVGYGFSVK